MQEASTLIPSFADVVEWTGVLVDAQFATIVLTPEYHSLVRETAAAVESALAVCHAAERLDGVLAQFRLRRLPRPSVPDYSIESIAF